MFVTTEESGKNWFCLRAKPKAEHIAAAHLQRFAGIDEVFCPRIRYEKSTTRGKVWFTEALFPGYLFARFELAEKLRAVNAANGVAGVVRFADKYPAIPDAYLDDLRNEFEESEQFIRVIEPRIEEGDEVVVNEGAMSGLRTVVTKLLPGKERVRILLDWLGQEREAEVARSSISLPGEIRSAMERR